MKKTLLYFFFIISLKSFSFDRPFQPRIQQEFNRADEVITGKVVSIDSLSLSTNDKTIYIYNFEIYKSYIAQFGLKNIKVITDKENYPQFELHKEYLVFLQEEFNLLFSPIRYFSTDLLENVDKETLQKLENLSKNRTVILQKVEDKKFKTELKNRIQNQEVYFKNKIKFQNFIIGLLSIVSALLVFLLLKNKLKKT